MKFQLFKKTNTYIPTLWGWILILGFFVISSLFFLFNIHPFLSKSAPVNGEYLIVEGWLPDYALKKAAEIFFNGNYKLIISTGGPLDQGSYLILYKTEAELASKSLEANGIHDSLCIAVPAASVRKDRTYQSAVAFKEWVKRSNPNIKKVDIISLGAHTRRSSKVFQNVLGSDIKVGQIAVLNEDYDPGRWWNSSEGAKTVISEIISNIYTFFFIHVF